jgi:hypothetical protein
MAVLKMSPSRLPSHPAPQVPGKLVLDVGSHIGWFTLWCLDHGAGSVVSVEADPTSARRAAALQTDRARGGATAPGCLLQTAPTVWRLYGGAEDATISQVPRA